MFDLSKRDNLTGADRERVKTSEPEYVSLDHRATFRIGPLWEKEQTKGEFEAFILGEIFVKLSSPQFTPAEKKLVADNVYTHVWQQAMRGGFARSA